MTATILIVEGKSSSQSSFADALEKAGYHTQSYHTGVSALASLEVGQPDLVVFDASSMRSSGDRICKRLKRKIPATPLIHIRDNDHALDRSTGADVYLQLPFTPRKLLNRIHGLLPVDEVKEEIVRYGSVSLYRNKRSVDIDGQGESQLTPKLAQLLEAFIRHPNQIVTRRQLMHDVWKTDYIGDTRTLDVHIRWIREIIEPDPATPHILRTVRGKGYIFSVPASAQEEPV